MKVCSHVFENVTGVGIKDYYCAAKPQGTLLYLEATAPPVGCVSTERGIAAE